MRWDGSSERRDEEQTRTVNQISGEWKKDEKENEREEPQRLRGEKEEEEKKDDRKGRKETEELPPWFEFFDTLSIHLYN